MEKRTDRKARAVRGRPSVVRLPKSIRGADKTWSDFQRL